MTKSERLFEVILRETETLEQVKARIETKLKKYAIEMKFVPFNMENYNSLLGNGVNTPCGYVKFGANQFAKLKGQDGGGRQNLIWAIRQTLEDPIVVIHNDAPVPTSNIPNPHENLTYAKSFLYSDNKKHRNNVNTIRSFVLLYNEDTEKVVISNSPIRIKQILDIIKKPDDIFYEKR